MRIELTVNGEATTVDVDPLARLLDVLRDELGLVGVKEGCGEGECGACAVMLNGRVVNSCITPAAAAAGREVVTIEGYRETGRYRVIEQAFADAGGVQCGFCTPGIVMATESILAADERPTDEQIRHGLSGNLCRCTGYTMIVEAVRLASERLHGDDD
ncbi:MAG: (2Fe-2S)-binding protein [bacterium]